MNCRAATKYTLPGGTRLQQLNDVSCVMNVTSPKWNSDGKVVRATMNVTNDRGPIYKDATF